LRHNRSSRVNDEKWEENMKIILPIAVIFTLLGGAFGAQAQTKLPDLKKQATAQAVLDEHFAALNACDWNRLLAQYPEDAQINLPNGVIVKGRTALGDLFAGFCKDAKTADSTAFSSPWNTQPRSRTRSRLNGSRPRRFWRSHTEALTPTSPNDGYMQAMVTTFDGGALKMKK
jgi:hypothetical protein